MPLLETPKVEYSSQAGGCKGVPFNCFIERKAYSGLRNSDPGLRWPETQVYIPPPILSLLNPVNVS
jgi:hypothetical protein